MPDRLGITDGDTPSGVTLVPITPVLLDQFSHETREVGPELHALINTPVASSYRIGAGDVLAIAVLNHPNLGNTPVADTGSANASDYPVSQDGFIQFPYLGSLHVQGQTEQAVREQITQGLARRFEKPQVTARVQQYRSGRIHVDGEVRTPGLQILDDIHMTLAEAIARAGGFGTDADRNALVLSRGEQNILIPLANLMAHGFNPASIRLQSGDWLRVPSRDNAKVYMLGEVLRPSALSLRDSQLRLSEALGEVGGLNPSSADASQVYVLRSQNGDRPLVFHLDASSPVAFALADRFALAPRDVVYIAPAPIVRWNRVISLLLPSGASLNNTAPLLHQ
jgi:polysaccharide export outer membrane protein